MNNIANSIPTGKSNAVHLETLVKELKISECKIKNMIQDARRNGIPIMSSRNGYWIAESKAEQESFIKTITLQGKARLKTARKLNQKSPLREQQT